MRTLPMLCGCLLVGLAPVAWANGGMMSRPSMPSMPRVDTPQQKAQTAYNDGVRDAKKADKAQAAADAATDAGRKDKAAREAHDAYASANAKFREAVGLDATLPEAWNYLGYTHRKLGNYDEALAAYAKALELKPGYADALEYRGEAYLGLSRIPDAQQAYLDLYAGNRVLAAKLLTAMKGWVAAQRTGGAGAGTAGASTAGASTVGASAADAPQAQATSLDDFDKWIQERTQIAGQTAALTRAGTAAAWR
jgi:tetratricopeptide (TPR) repeat protein